MKTISADIQAEINQIGDAGALLLLVELYHPATASTNRYVRNHASITYNTYTYYPTAMEFGDINETLQGDLPTFTLRIGHTPYVYIGSTTNEFADSLNTYNGLIGSTVTIKLVHSDHLALTPELTYIFEILETEQDANWVTFTLGIPNPLTTRFPRDRYVPSLCRFLFKGDYCQYTGSQTTCNHTLTRCRTLANSLHFGGSPGIAEDVYGG